MFSENRLVKTWGNVKRKFNTLSFAKPGDKIMLAFFLKNNIFQSKLFVFLLNKLIIFGFNINLLRQPKRKKKASL